MQPRTKQALELTLVVLGQTILLFAAWGFVIAIGTHDPLTLNSNFVGLLQRYQTEQRWLTTAIATAVSIASSKCLAIAFREALRHRVHSPISLARLSGGVALARGAFYFNLSFRHWEQILITLAIFVTTSTLVSSWTTLLTPTTFAWNVTTHGSELDVNSNWLDTALQNAAGDANASTLYGFGSVLGGVTAAQYGSGTAGIFNFNGVKYNVSTGGIFPVISSYNSSSQSTANNNSGLLFAGGSVPTNFSAQVPSNRTFHPLNNSLTLTQQGLTANVTCTQGELNPSAVSSPSTVSLPGGGTVSLLTWNISLGCSEGIPAAQQYVTLNTLGTGFAAPGLVASLVCPFPSPEQTLNLTWQSFTVTTYGYGKYGFLPSAVCTITPLVTSSLVQYSGGIVDVTVLESQPLGSNSYLALMLADLISFYSWTTQSLTSNILGDSLYSINVATTGNSAATEGDLLNELELYWRGIIELTGTFIRSGFSLDPNSTQAQVELTGFETITVTGWKFYWKLIGFTVLPITVVSLLTYAVAFYTFWIVWKGWGDKSSTAFDPSDPIHLMMVSSKRVEGEEDNLGDHLAGFDKDDLGLIENEGRRVEVRLVPAETIQKRAPAVEREEGKKKGEGKKKVEQVDYEYIRFAVESNGKGEGEAQGPVQGPVQGEKEVSTVASGQSA